MMGGNVKRVACWIWYSDSGSWRITVGPTSTFVQWQVMLRSICYMYRRRQWWRRGGFFGRRGEIINAWLGKEANKAFDLSRNRTTNPPNMERTLASFGNIESLIFNSRRKSSMILEPLSPYKIYLYRFDIEGIHSCLLRKEHDLFWGVYNAWWGWYLGLKRAK